MNCKNPSMVLIELKSKECVSLVVQSRPPPPSAVLLRGRPCPSQYSGQILRFTRTERWRHLIAAVRGVVSWLSAGHPSIDSHCVGAVVPVLVQRWGALERVERVRPLARSPTRIAITKSILQRGNTCRGMQTH